MATIQLTDGLMLMIDPPSTYYRIWYTGYPASDEWMKNEAKNALMAADNTLTEAEAQSFINDIYEEAYKSVNSAVNKNTDAGIIYSLALTSQDAVSLFFAKSCILIFKIKTTCGIVFSS